MEENPIGSRTAWHYTWHHARLQIPLAWRWSSLKNLIWSLNRQAWTMPRSFPAKALS